MVPTFIGDLLQAVSGMMMCLLHVFSFLFAVAWSCMIIAIAWVAVRPMVGIPILVIGIGCFVFFFVYLIMQGQKTRAKQGGVHGKVQRAKTPDAPDMPPPPVNVGYDDAPPGFYDGQQPGAGGATVGTTGGPPPPGGAPGY